MMKSILTTIAFLALAVAGLAQTRSVIVNTSGVVQSPTNFWSADVVNARSGLGLGTAATNAATAFQPSSLVLSNLSSSNGGALTNLTAANITGTVALASNVTGTVALASNVTGTIAISNGGSGATTTAGARTNFGLGAFSTNEIGFGNVKMGNFGVNFIEPVEQATVFGLPTDTDPVYLNPIHWNDGGVRTALGLGLSVLTNTNTSNFRTAIGLGVTNDVTFGSVTASSIKNSAGTRALDLENFSLTFGTNYVLEWSATNAQFSKPLTFFGTNVAATTRTNLSLGWLALTNPQSSLYSGTATTLMGYVAETNPSSPGLTGFNVLAYTNTNSLVIPANLLIAEDQAPAPRNLRYVEIRGTATIGHPFTDDTIFGANYASVTDQLTFTNTIATWSSNAVTMGIPIAFSTNTVTATTRTNLGLGWSALTNSNAGTGLVSVSTNGEVVSPTNFWQVAPISTTVQYQTNVTATSTNAATNSRNLFLFSLAPTVSAVTNTVTLPTNPATTFEGDRTTIIHLATNSANTVTAIRQLGAATNLITLHQNNETVLFMYRSGAWGLADNISYVEPIQFSGTNSAGHAAESRTNLGLGSTNGVTFSTLTLSSDLTLGSGDNIVLSTTTGTKIGTATNQLLGFYNQTPITRPSSTGVTTNGFVANGPANSVHANSTFTGGIGTNAYTISDIVTHLKSLGLLAP